MVGSHCNSSLWWYLCFNLGRSKRAFYSYLAIVGIWMTKNILHKWPHKIQLQVRLEIALFTSLEHLKSIMLKITAREWVTSHFPKLQNWNLIRCNLSYPNILFGSGLTPLHTRTHTHCNIGPWCWCFYFRWSEWF